MTASVSSIALMGLEAKPVDVEVDLAAGVPEFHIVGLPSAAVREARRRVRSAIVNSAEVWPQRKVTVSLAPGDLRKDGALLDLAIAVGIVVAGKSRLRHRAGGYLFLGELALDGKLRPVRGALAGALVARERGDGLILPRKNAMEAALVPGVEVVGADHLAEVLAFLSGNLQPAPAVASAEALLAAGAADPRDPDLSDVRGQALARRALEIAAVGGHNLLLVGPPGSGKTMLARRLRGILPPMTVEEALEVTRIWSVAGLLEPGDPLVTRRPFRAPHHHASAAAVIGGGSPSARPGEVSIAHNGVLFLDEMPLFNRAVLDALRQPVEDGAVTIARRDSALTFPARVSLVAAANPCPCGHLGDTRKPCSCPPGRIESYRSRLSGPLLDRFDLFAEVPRLTEQELMEFGPAEASTSVKTRVLEAKIRRDSREPAGGSPGTLRERMESLAGSARHFLMGALAREPASARAVDRILRVARTIADLEADAIVSDRHIAEALQFRRIVWEG